MEREEKRKRGTQEEQGRSVLLIYIVQLLRAYEHILALLRFSYLSNTMLIAALALAEATSRVAMRFVKASIFCCWFRRRLT